MKKKHIIISIIISVSVMAVIAVAFTFLGANKADEYYFREYSNLYEMQLSTTINTMIPVKHALNDKNYGDLNSLNKQLRECQINFKKTVSMIINFEVVLNRKNNKIIYDLNPIAKQFEDYAEMISDQIDSGVDIIIIDKIFQDISLIYETQLFKDNQNTYEEIKMKWNSVVEELNYKPEFEL